MRGLSQRITSFMKRFFYKDDKGKNRLIFNLTGLLVFVAAYFLLSVVLFFFLNYNITRNDGWFEADLKLANTIKEELSVLSFGREYSASNLNQLMKLVDSFSAESKANQKWRPVKISAGNIIKESTGLKQDRDNPKVKEELVKIRTSIDELVRSLIDKRQNINENLFSRLLIYEIGLVLLIVLLVCSGAFSLIKVIKNQESEVAYFEGIAHQFKAGLLNKIKFDYQGKYLTELSQIIIRFFQLINERYQAVKDQIKNLNFQTNEISLFFSQNDTFYSEIKRDLEQLVENLYHQDDKYQVLTERIKLLNFNLLDSHQQIVDQHESLKNMNHLFQEAPEEIGKVANRVKNREQYLKKVVGDLYQLHSILEQLLHTGSVFQSVAEQNALLALNASIEAARAETAVGGFDIAAEEITLLAEKVGRVSKELLAVVDTMGVKGNVALKTLEIDLARNNDVKFFIDAVGNKINVFCLKLNALLEDVIQYSIQIEELEEKRKTLEEFIVSLGELNRRSQSNYGRAESALEVIKKSGETIAVSEQIDSLALELKHLMNKIAI